jgi:nicotinamidase-related amidase
MSAGHVLESNLAVLVVIDVQEKMLSAVTPDAPNEIIAPIRRIIGAARILDIPILHTEQYPQGLGPTVAELRGPLAESRGPLVKAACSCWRDETFRNELQRTEREHVILAGLETHVCIQQTALDLLRVDYVPFVAADATGSRRALDKVTALARLRAAGVIVSTTEALIFELVERCDHPRFKDVLKVIKG